MMMACLWLCSWRFSSVRSEHVESSLRRRPKEGRLPLSFLVHEIGRGNGDEDEDKDDRGIAFAKRDKCLMGKTLEVWWVGELRNAVIA